MSGQCRGSAGARRAGRCCWSTRRRGAATSGSTAIVARLGPAASRCRARRLRPPDELEADIRARAGAGRHGDRLRRRRQPLPGGARRCSRTGLALGILPMGTANDLARTLGIPDDLEARGRHDPRRAPPADRPRQRQRPAVLQRRLDRALGRPRARALVRPEAALGAARLRAWRRSGRWRAPGASRPGSARTATRPAPARCRSRSATAASTAAAPWSRPTPTIDDGHLDLYSLELRTVWRLALMLRAFRTGEHGAWSEVRTAARHRVRDPHPPPAPGQRRRRADRRDAGGLQGDAEGARGPCAGEGVIPSRVTASVRRRACFRRRSCPPG